MKLTIKKIIREFRLSHLYLLLGLMMVLTYAFDHKGFHNLVNSINSISPILIMFMLYMIYSIVETIEDAEPEDLKIEEYEPSTE